MYCQPEKFLYSKQFEKKGTNRVGEGKYGQVFVGCTRQSCRHQIAIKKSLDDMSHEYKMMKKAYQISPNHVPKPLHFFKCSGGSIIYYEFIKSKTLSKIHIDKCILFQILKTLYKFQKHGIKHNDLHLNNILIEDGTHRAVITDFGFANPKDTSMSEDYGINPRSDSRYDYHLLFNSLFNKCKVSSVCAFISKIIPAEYLGAKTSKVNNFRLRYGVKYPGLPSLRQVIYSSFFDSCRRKILPTNK